MSWRALIGLNYLALSQPVATDSRSKQSVSSNRISILSIRPLILATSQNIHYLGMLTELFSSEEQKFPLAVAPFSFFFPWPLLYHFDPNGSLLPYFKSPSNTTKLENATLFLRSGLPSTLIRHDHGAFSSKTLFWPTNYLTPALRFTWRENTLKTELFENVDITIIMWFPCSSFPQTQTQNDRWMLRFQISLA